MDEKKALSPEAVAMLQKIHDVGLTAHHHLKVATYEWGDDSPFTHEDQRILDRELSRIVQHYVSYPHPAEITLRRERIADGVLYDECVALFPASGDVKRVMVTDADMFNIEDVPDAIIYDQGGKFIAHTLQERVVTMSASVSPYVGADGVVSQSVTVNQEYHPVRYSTWESDYLRRVELESSYEYGISERIELKEAAARNATSGASEG